MYWQFVLAVMRRAFQPTARFTDVLQILAASAAPAVAKFLGFPVPTPEDTLAYIGAAALAFVFLRVFFVAPYQVWREQHGQIGTLEIELAKPERIERNRLAEIRADARGQLAENIAMICMLAASAYKGNKASASQMRQITYKTVALAGRGNCSHAFHRGFSWFAQRSYDIGEGNTEQHEEAVALANSLISYLHGDITNEALVLRLPPGIELETQP